jgi:ubiquinone/menaquinone biosynthesis C-methylase UbiE
MGMEVDLLVNYPRTNRNVEERGATKTEEDRAVARKFGKDFFDGDRKHGYGGFRYMPRFWQPVVPTVQKHYSLKPGDSLLDVGCAKGFMMHDFATLIPGLRVAGVDISPYAIENAMEDMKPLMKVANAATLPYPDKSFDVVISINTIHNLDREDCGQALREIERVARRGAFITVDAYRTEEEKKRMYQWNLTAKTIMSVDEWVAFFKHVGYTGDYYWFIP